MAANRIGIFAGTFDPVHHGHMAFAQAATKLCHLDKVIFLPEREPRGKHGVTDIKHRVAMLELAGADVLVLSDSQFTVAKTLPELQRRLPGAHLVLLVGADIAAHLRSWPDAEELLAQTELAVGFREGIKPLHDIKATIIPTEHAHVAASHVRKGVSDAIDPAVRAYIQQHGLYKV